MKYLFDASALLNIIRSYGDLAIDFLKNNYIIQLAFYEIGNAIWKELFLIKSIDLEEALFLLGLVGKLSHYLILLEDSDSSVILEIAYKLGITFYDASYVVAAAEKGLALITDDNKLIRKIENGEDFLEERFGQALKVFSTEDLSEEF
ncbi:MAG: toxin VapC [Thermoprotei archaeon]|nr:MAG: toxin VapC [Thermoprotei archaeon]